MVPGDWARGLSNAGFTLWLTTFPMLSQTAEYAMRAVVCLADRAPAPQTSDQLAEATQVPGHYLSKVLQLLCREDLLRSQRGLGGGFTLARDPETMTLLDVINVVEPIRRIHTCPLDIAAHGSSLCPLHRRLDDVLAKIEETFADATLAQIVAGRKGSVPLCPFPRAPKAVAASS
jgi:Rrf2 family protein